MRRTVYFIRMSGGFVVSIVNKPDRGITSIADIAWGAPA